MRQPLTASFVMSMMIMTSSSPAQMRVPENIPITFYGKAIDQDGNPVVEATVNVSVVISHMDENRTESKAITLHTDENGKFVLTGVTGFGINIFIQKKGYELSSKAQQNYTFGFNPDYHPSLSHPYVFQMWKEQGKEALVGASWHGKISCDGTTNRFNLSSGKRSAAGELVIILTRQPLNLPPANTKPFTYNVHIGIIGGGIQIAEDEFAYLAPATNYSSMVAFEQNASDPNWDRKTPIPTEYYLRTADGHYGTLYLELYLWQASPVHCAWSCAINPSGSRNLER